MRVTITLDNATDIRWHATSRADDIMARTFHWQCNRPFPAPYSSEGHYGLEDAPHKPGCLCDTYGLCNVGERHDAPPWLSPHGHPFNLHTTRWLDSTLTEIGQPR